jgi:hypothetical protein
MQDVAYHHASHQNHAIQFVILPAGREDPTYRLARRSERRALSVRLLLE